MKHTTVFLAFFLLLNMATLVQAQLPVKPLAPQSELLRSDNPKHAANKKLVYDMFRIENGKIAEHWDSSEKMKLN